MAGGAVRKTRVFLTGCAPDLTGGHPVAEVVLPGGEQRRLPGLPEHLSDEELTRDWSLDPVELAGVKSFRKRYRLFGALQLRAVRLLGRFIKDPTHAPPKIVAYLASQLDLATPLFVLVPTREATRLEQQKVILGLAGFQRFDEVASSDLEAWLEREARHGDLPATLIERAERRLLKKRVLLPGPTTLERLVVSVCSTVHDELFEAILAQLSPELRDSIDALLSAPADDQRSFFYRLKQYPPSPTITSMKQYLERYEALEEIFQLGFEPPVAGPAFSEYLSQLARQYTAKDLKRFGDPKRYALLVCFLQESRKVLLDHLVEMHDKFVLNLYRTTKSAYEKQYRALRTRQKVAVDAVLVATRALLEWPEDEPRRRRDFLEELNEERLRESVEDLRQFQRLGERGYGDLLLTRYPNLRKYFSGFVRLPFAAEKGSEPLLRAIEIVRRLDDGELTSLPADAPTSFVPGELRRALRRSPSGPLQRNAWEMGLALALRDALRSGDLYLPQSKQHVSFWDLLISETRWKQEGADPYMDLQQPVPTRVRAHLVEEFHQGLQRAHEQFDRDPFARLEQGRLHLRRDDTRRRPDSRLQRTITASLPRIRVEQLLMEVDQATGFSQCFVPLQQHRSRPEQFYKSLLAAIISQATNLGVVSMSASVEGITLDMLRHLLQHYVRDETLKDANAAIVDAHHRLPLSALHGSGQMSSSDAQRFRIRADSLLASYYPRYFGYYEKAISLYTHVSDQYAVFGTRAISCGPREALYVLDGLLDNNTILRIRDHTTDTDGYTEILFALCYLLGFSFLPRIKNLKRQQLYRPERHNPGGEFGPLLSKTVDLDLVENQWDPMMRVAFSLKLRTAPANVVVQRLTSSSPHDRLSKAVRHLGRLVKTNYILRYCTDRELRQDVQRQLNKGEYRQKLSRWIFFADQGEFTTGDYVEIMNKATCLSLVSNAILYWNTVKMAQVVDRLRAQGETISDEDLSHVSLLPFKHVMPNGTYFNEADEGASERKPTVSPSGGTSEP